MARDPLVFGVDRDPGVVAVWAPGPNGKGRPKRPPLSSRPNPMVVALGEGPADKVCGDCAFLVWKGGSGSHRYFGCTERGPLNNGPSTDHLVRWPSCAAFKQSEESAT